MGMKTLFFAFTLVLTLSTLSHAQDNTRDPLAGAYQFCESLSFSSEKRECITIVSQTRFFDPTGLAFCKTGFNFGSDQLKCMRSVANQVFEPSLVGFCSTLSFAASKHSCVTVITGKFPRSDAALSACSSLNFDHDKLECLKTVVVDQVQVVVPPRTLCTREQFQVLISDAKESFQRGAFANTLRRFADLTSLVEQCFR
jgi:hypothetical protein